MGWMDAAKKRLEGQDVEFMEGSSEELPLADASFDRYAANFVLYVAPSSPSSPHKSTLHATSITDRAVTLQRLFALAQASGDVAGAHAARGAACVA